MTLNPRWYVKSDRDLNVGVTYKGKESSEEKVIQPITKTHCSKMAYRDTLLCDEPGTCEYPSFTPVYGRLGA